MREIPSSMSGPKLAAWLHFEERTAGKVLQQAGLKLTKRQFETHEAVDALAAYLWSRVNSIDTEVERDKAATVKANRISAEAEALKKQDQLMLQEDAEKLWSDRVVRIRQVIESFPISLALRKKLVEDILKIR